MATMATPNAPAERVAAFAPRGERPEVVAGLDELATHDAEPACDGEQSGRVGGSGGDRLLGGGVEAVEPAEELVAALEDALHGRQDRLADVGLEVLELGVEGALAVGERVGGVGEVALDGRGLLEDQREGRLRLAVVVDCGGRVGEAHLDGTLPDHLVVEHDVVAADRFGLATDRGTDRLDGVGRVGC